MESTAEINTGNDMTNQPIVRPRIWPLVLFAVTGLTCMLLPTWLSMDDSIRFAILALGAALHLLLLGLWVLFGSRTPWRDRLLGLSVGIATIVAVFLLQDDTMGINVLLFGMPVALAVLAVVFVCTSQVNWPARKWITMSTWVVSLLLWLGLRNEGMVASFAPQLALRWTPETQTSVDLTERAEVAPKQLEQLQSISLQPGDWPRFRGPDSNGQAIDTELKLGEQIIPTLVWKQPVGFSWSSVIVVDNLLYSQEQRDEEEAVVCFDANTGAQVWLHTDKSRFEDMTKASGVGPRGTPTFADGRIYTVGGTGLVNCLNAIDGTKIWQRNINDDAKTSVAMWGYSTSPAIIENKCFIQAGGRSEEASETLCYDAQTGEIIWSSKGSGETYSSAEVAKLAGQQQLLTSVGGITTGRDLTDGHELWNIVGATRGNTMLMPLALGDDNLIVASGEGDGTSLYKISHEEDQWTAKKIWTCKKLRPDFNDVVVLDDFVLGLSKGLLTCASLDDGKLLWKKFRFASGQLISLPSHHAVLVLSEEGELSIVAVTADDATMLATWPAVSGKTWNHPVLVGNRIYCRSAEELACYEIKD